jgi:hypothetical protein
MSGDTTGPESMLVVMMYEGHVHGVVVSRLADRFGPTTTTLSIFAGTAPGSSTRSGWISPQQQRSWSTSRQPAPAWP